MYVRMSMRMVKKLFKMMYPEKAMNDGFSFVSTSTRSFHVYLRPTQLFYNLGHLNRKCTANGSQKSSKTYEHILIQCNFEQKMYKKH